MLLAIREKVSGWVAYGIIFLISVPFALFGVSEYLGGGEALPAATVDGEDVSQQQLDQAYAGYRQRLAQLFGGSIPVTFGDEAMMREQVLGQLVDQVAMRQFLESNRYRVSDQDLNQMIWEMEMFQIDGRFDSQRYQAQLQSIGYSPESFKAEVLRNRVLEQFEDAILSTAFVTQNEIRDYAALNNQTRKVRSLTFNQPIESVEVTPAEIELYYQQNMRRFQTPERMKVDFIELNLDRIKQNIEIDQAQIRSRYEQNIATYSSPEFRTASHILIKVGADDDSATALAKIKNLRQRLIDGDQFAALAAEFSEDSGSAAEGGDLGEIERGAMQPAFETALYALPLNGLSQPVKTAFGWHLIQLNGITGGEVQTFESLRDAITDEMRTELAESQIYDLVEDLSNLTYEQSDSLRPAAEQLGLEVETSDWFSRNKGDGIGAEAKVRGQAFSPVVLVDKLNSAAIELDSERVVFIRLNQHQAPEQQPLAEVNSVIKSELTSAQHQELNQIAGEQGLSELITGKTLGQLADEWSSEIEDFGFISRNQDGIDSQLRQAVFRMPKPNSDSEIDRQLEGLLLSSGGYAIVELLAVESPELDTESDVLERVAQAQANAEYQAIRNLVAARAEVVRNSLDNRSGYDSGY